MRVAILVDGGFYRKRAVALFGEKNPKERADELWQYCLRHCAERSDSLERSAKELYRIFYYDCPPLEKTVYHPFLKKEISLKKTPLYSWTTEFFLALASKRKTAIRRGELLESDAEYTLNPDAQKRLLNGTIQWHDLTEKDFRLDVKQKGVDLRIGLDIASMAHKKQVDQIVLIAGDSDFVPAAKYARREGIDFILDPLWQPIRPSLSEHIDGLYTCTPKPGSQVIDPLCIKPGGPVR